MRMHVDTEPLLFMLFVFTGCKNTLKMHFLADLCTDMGSIAVQSPQSDLMTSCHIYNTHKDDKRMGFMVQQSQVETVC